MSVSMWDTDVEATSRECCHRGFIQEVTCKGCGTVTTVSVELRDGEPVRPAHLCPECGDDDYTPGKVFCVGCQNRV